MSFRFINEVSNGQTIRFLLKALAAESGKKLFKDQKLVELEIDRVKFIRCRIEHLPTFNNSLSSSFMNINHDLVSNSCDGMCYYLYLSAQRLKLANADGEPGYESSDSSYDTSITLARYWMTYLFHMQEIPTRIIYFAQENSSQS